MITKDNENLRYCLQFLRNGGERFRAVKLCVNVLEMKPGNAVKFVDSLKTAIPLVSPIRRDVVCVACGVTWLPGTETCPHCGSRELYAKVRKH